MTRIEANWVERFRQQFELCGVAAGETALVLSESASRHELVETSALALETLAARVVRLRLPTPPNRGPVPIRSTGASVAIDANRYSVPWRLIGKTVEVVRVGDCWQISHQGTVVAEHPVLAGRHRVHVDPAHGPGAVGRNARTRFSDATTATPATLHEIEVRDLAVYERLLG